MENQADGRMSVHGAVAGTAGRFGPDPVILGIVAYFVVHMMIRIFGSSNFAVDETGVALHSQSFELYYVLRNPPLIDWLFLGLSRLTGVNLLTYQLIKTALLIAAGVFLYLAIRPGFRHRAALDAAIMSYGATAFFGWEVLQQYAHIITMIFAMAFALWALLRVARSARTGDYLLLGLGLGLGLLSKYLFGLYFAALLLAALFSPSYRPAILSWRMVLTFVVGLIVVSPLLVGLIDVAADARSEIGSYVAEENARPTAVVLGRALLLTLLYLLPFAAILAACLALWPAKAAEGAAENASAEEDIYPLLRNVTVIMVVAVSAAALLLGTRVSQGHYLAPVYFLLPPAVFGAIDRRAAFPALALRQFRRGAMGFIVGLAIVRFAIFLFVAPPFCVPRCVVFVDYAPVVERIGTEAGKQTVILTDHLYIGANLLGLVPDARVIMARRTDGMDLGIAPPESRNCFLVWFRKYRNDEEVPLARALELALRRQPTEDERAAIGLVDYVKAEWQTKLLRDRGPDTIVGIARIDGRQRICSGDGRLSDPPQSDAAAP